MCFKFVLIVQILKQLFIIIHEYFQCNNGNIFILNKVWNFCFCFIIIKQKTKKTYINYSKNILYSKCL